MSVLEGQAGDVDEDEQSFTASVDRFHLLFPDLNDSGVFVNSDSTVGGSETSNEMEVESDGDSVELGAL